MDMSRWVNVRARIGCCAVAATVFAATELHAEQTLKSLTQTRVNTQEALLASQKRIDGLDQETRTMLEEYRQVLRQTESLRDYNDQLDRTVQAQQQQLLSLQRQLSNARETQQRIVPLIRNMIDVLEQLVRLDMPFLKEERAMRLQSLRQLIDRPDVTLADKYRRVLEAYQVEMDYGRTIEAYNGEIERSGQQRTVDFLRVGRVALLYLTFDGAEAGYWDQPARKWQVLPKDYLQALRNGLQIARKQAPPDLMKVPVPAPGSSQ